jgi:hypothetical protein
MKRFANSIKLMQVNEFLLSYICFSFSLLANCTELELVGEYYRAICVTFLTPFDSEQVSNSKTKIKAGVSERPESINDLQKILKRYNLNPTTLDLNFVSDIPVNQKEGKDDDMSKNEEESNNSIQSFKELDDDEVEEDDDDDDSNDDDEESEESPEIEETFQKDSIKNNSKFYHYFKNIRSEVENEISSDSNSNSKNNDFYCPQIIDHLQEKFMAYIFAWGGLALKGTGLTRMTNGVLEVYQGFVKKRADKDVLPHKHVISNYETVNGCSVDYLSSIDKLSCKKSSKRKSGSTRTK